MPVTLIAGLVFGLGLASADAFDQALEERAKPAKAYVLEKLRKHDLLIFDDGFHPAVEPFEFIEELVRDPEFQRLRPAIYLEVLPMHRQPCLDAYVNSPVNDKKPLLPAFQDTYDGDGWPLATYFSMLETVRLVNQKLPAEQRLRVVAVSNPVYWEGMHTQEDVVLFRKSLEDRDHFMYSLIRGDLQGFKKGAKGVFITNTRHAYNGVRNSQGELYWNCATYFRQSHPGKTWSVRFHNYTLNILRERVTDPSRLGSASGTDRMEMRMVRSAGGKWDDAFARFSKYPIGLDLAGNAFGKSPYEGNHMLDAQKGSTMADAYDGLIYLAPVETLRFSSHITDLYTPEFKRELVRRLQVLHTEAQIAEMLKGAGVNSLELYIDKVRVARPERLASVALGVSK